MDVEFEDDAYARLETDPTFTAGFAAAIVTAYRKKLWLIRSAVDERAFYAMRSLHFEKLKGDREGRYAMRLNDQWRLILRLVARDAGKSVVIIAIVDYH